MSLFCLNMCQKCKGTWKSSKFRISPGELHSIPQTYLCFVSGNLLIWNLKKDCPIWGTSEFFFREGCSFRGGCCLPVAKNWSSTNSSRYLPPANNNINTQAFAVCLFRANRMYMVMQCIVSLLLQFIMYWDTYIYIISVALKCE